MIRRIFSRRAALPLLLLVLAIAPIPALALLVRPVLMDLTTTGPDASGSFEVVNDRNRPITVEIAVNRLAIPEEGDVVVTPDEGADFQIFPPIATIPAGARQIFRVRWVGEPVIPESRLFMFSTSELPVSEEGAPNGLQVLYAINSVVAVRSPDAQPNLTIQSIVRGTGREGQPGLQITFVNDGPAHGYVPQGTLELGGPGDWSRTLRPADLNSAVGLGIIPANGRRRVFVPVTDLPATGDISGRFRPVPRQGFQG